MSRAFLPNLGMSKSFPFTFPTFPKLLKPFPVADYSFPGKGKEGKDLSPFPKLLKPFPVAAFPFPVATFPFPVVTFPAFPGNSPLLGPLLYYISA